ncbi:response regulator [Psychromonas antarctica]|uniref:response regulator n=1 Tax=Psychromonas antarctica TaxID=67573 RepID=UPI0023B03503|nr:response regulator [Psychromonas antarctica]
MFSYKNKKILIVDDQKAFHIMLKTMLTNQGAKNISFADSAESAIRLAQHKAFDIYLIDYNLGSGKNGVQLIDYLRRNELISNSSLCFIITGDNQKSMVLTAIETSPDDYLMKPFSQTQLFNRLSRADQKKNVFADIFDALQQKSYSHAITLCQDRIITEPKYSGLCKNLLADIFIQTEQYQAAQKILTALVKKRPLVRASISLAKTHYLQENYSEAIKLLKTVIDNTPLQMEAYQWLARAYQRSGKLSKALNMLTHAANMTHHSIERHQEVALLANEMDEHQIMVSSYAAILQLSRHSFYPDPSHLANYIHSILDHAQNQEDISERKTILKKVNSALYQSRFEEGRNKHFDFNRFDEICQAKIAMAMDEPLKAKRKIFSTLENSEIPIAELDNTLLCESIFSLLDIGEFDYATPYLDELKQREIINPSMQASIKKCTGEKLTIRIERFKAHNQSGIEAFAQKEYEHALNHFNQALKLEALNSGALLNRIQVYIELLKQAKNDQKSVLLTNCQDSFNLLSNTHLPKGHTERYNKLKNEFNEFKY